MYPSFNLSYLSVSVSVYVLLQSHLLYLLIVSVEGCWCTWWHSLTRAFVMTPLDEWSARRRDVPDTTQHSQDTDIHAPGMIRTPNPNKREAAYITRHTARPFCNWLLSLYVSRQKIGSKCRRLNAVNSDCTAGQWRKEAICIITNRNSWTTHCPASVVLLLAAGSVRVQ